ncbi:uncharacterized protein V6R79_000046 [Siganus canaliculatus]
MTSVLTNCRAHDASRSAGRPLCQRRESWQFNEKTERPVRVSVLGSLINVRGPGPCVSTLARRNTSDEKQIRRSIRDGSVEATSVLRQKRTPVTAASPVWLTSSGKDGERAEAYLPKTARVTPHLPPQEAPRLNGCTQRE